MQNFGIVVFVGLCKQQVIPMEATHCIVVCLGKSDKSGDQMQHLFVAMPVFHLTIVGLRNCTMKPKEQNVVNADDEVVV